MHYILHNKLHQHFPYSFFTYQLGLFSSVVALEEQRASLARELNTSKHSHSKVGILLLPMTFRAEHVSAHQPFSVSWYPVSPDISGSAGKEKGVGEGRFPSKVSNNVLLCLFSTTDYPFPPYLLSQPLWNCKEFSYYETSYETLICSVLYY